MLGQARGEGCFDVLDCSPIDSDALEWKILEEEAPQFPVGDKRSGEESSCASKIDFGLFLVHKPLGLRPTHSFHKLEICVVSFTEIESLSRHFAAKTPSFGVVFVVHDLLHPSTDAYQEDPHIDCCDAF